MKTLNKTIGKDIVIMADTQITKDSDTSHIQKFAEYCWAHKPSHIVCIGDMWDFESLSFYASAKEKEGRRLVDDLKAGQDALKIVPDYIDMMNKKSKKKAYKPEFHFTAGNHEDRLDRMLSDNPHLIGLIDLRGMVADAGWKYHEFLYPVWIDGIMFNHFLPNPQSGKPIGGSIDNKLNKIVDSFVVGHQQIVQMGRRDTMSGRPHFGVVAGSFYQEDEGYRGSCNNEQRGFMHLVNYTNRMGFSDYEMRFVALEHLLAM